MKNKGEILSSLLREYQECFFFFHNTREYNIVEKILNEGFIFESQLLHSCDQINPEEPVEITYFFLQRKDYGPYTVILAIPKEIYAVYAECSLQNDTGIEEIITISDPDFSENEELIYTVSKKHVLGYFNTLTSEFFKNPVWDPGYNNCFYRSPARRPVKSGKQKYN